MFGGSTNLEQEKSSDALQKLAQTTVLDFGEQNTKMTPASLCLWHFLLYRVVEVSFKVASSST